MIQPQKKDILKSVTQQVAPKIYQYIVAKKPKPKQKQKKLESHQ